MYREFMSDCGKCADRSRRYIAHGERQSLAVVLLLEVSLLTYYNDVVLFLLVH